MFVRIIQNIQADVFLTKSVYIQQVGIKIYHIKNYCYMKNVYDIISNKYFKQLKLIKNDTEVERK